MGDKKSEYEEALEELDEGEQPLAYIEGSREDEGTKGVLIATDKRLFWFDKLVFGMKTKKSYAYADYESVKVEDARHRVRVQAAQQGAPRRGQQGRARDRAHQVARRAEGGVPARRHPEARRVRAGRVAARSAPLKRRGGGAAVRPLPRPFACAARR